MSPRFETILRRPITLSYATYDVLHSGVCGEDAPKPAGLEGLSPGRSSRERVRIIKDALAELRDLGLAVVDDPAPSVRETVRLLHNPHRRFYGWYGFLEGSEQVNGSFHLAESDDLAVLAVRERGQVLLEPVDCDELLSTVTSLLPDAAEPVADAEIVVAAERPRPRVRPDDGELPFVDRVRDRTEREAVQLEHDRVEQLTSGPQYFVMQVGKAHRSFRGQEKVSEFPLNYYFGAEGAVLSVFKRTGPDEEPRRHVIPAAHANVLRELRAL